MTTLVYNIEDLLVQYIYKTKQHNLGFLFTPLWHLKNKRYNKAICCLVNSQNKYKLIIDSPRIKSCSLKKVIERFDKTDPAVSKFFHEQVFDE